MTEIIEQTNNEGLWQTLDDGSKAKLVNLIQANMPVTQMADFLQLSLTDTQQLLNEPELKQLVACKEAEEKLGDLNTAVSWDAVEQKALKAVLAELNSMPDPDFALRAALSANKAVRKHKQKQTSNIAELVTEGAKVVTLQLNHNVVNNLVTAQDRILLNSQKKENQFVGQDKVLDVFSGRQMMELSNTDIKLTKSIDVSTTVKDSQFIDTAGREVITKEVIKQKDMFDADFEDLLLEGDLK